MRLRTTAILATAALGLAIPASGLAEDSTTIGTGKKSCVLKPGADCRGVVHRWTVEHHGNLRKAKFTRADLRGADFRGADLRGADFRGAKLHHADLRGARLKGARFDVVKRVGKGANGAAPICPLNACQGQGAQLVSADFSGADLTGAYFWYANLMGANFTGTNLTRAHLGGAFLGWANLTSANLTSANLTGAFLNYATLAGANLTNVIWSNTTCPNGTVTNTGC